MTMHRETLRAHLHNAPLVQAIEQKRVVDLTKRQLADAMQVLREVGAHDGAIDEAQRKFDEYVKISRAYGNLIEDVFGISWQAESIIRMYTECCDNDIDRLPEHIKFG